MTRSRSRRALAVVAAAVAALALAAGCSRAQEAPSSTPVADQGPAQQLRLGYFPNITHAGALIGVQNGLFAQNLGQTKLTTETFNAGPEETAALLGNSIDIGFIGSGPAINAYKQNPDGIRVISGATSGGAQLVVRPGITSPQQLLGKKIATPQLANTQDIALKKWLKENNLPIGTGPGAVEVVNIDNARALDAYKTGQLDGGWLPEPYASQFVLQAGATQLIDERTLWPNGQFPTTVVIARTDFVQAHPATVAAFLKGLVAAEDLGTSNPAAAKAAANAGLGASGSKPLPQNVLDRAWSSVSLNPDPLAALFPQLAQDAVTAGTAKSATNVKGLIDVGPLNQALTQAGRPTVDAAGLDQK
ncbi:ABC transporter substrate-binding protein [Actinomycetospora sp. TBRC 11914]|uniref:ABC transporter substrate-binding protein n=1 Tax=Actinomycetospora sp. TBRC 11914 TaxID=2729387 RepID=UPI00145F0361|nr:ABC transporter substrate-binding protein [Actinomycetospora sp. TBRC 11914]NMO91455.1 ABC transporter substrate-binding protein [Actinomycetospora sp. TBRC 11914]